MEDERTAFLKKPDRNSFVFHANWVCLIDILDESEQLYMYNTIVQYALTGVEIQYEDWEVSPEFRAFFANIKPVLDAQRKNSKDYKKRNQKSNSARNSARNSSKV